MRARFAAVIALMVPLLLMLGASRSAHADAPDVADARSRADAILRQAERDDEAFAFPQALARYDEGRALDPGSPRAPRAEARAAMLRAHAEGDFVPYTKLERVRRAPALSSDPRVVDELVRDADGFPPGLVRVEVWVFAAEAYARRLGRSADAEPLLHRVVGDPITDVVVLHKAARDLADLRIARGDLAGAEEAVRLAGARGEPKLASDVRRIIRRRSLHRASIALLVAVLVLAARAWVVAVRRGAGGRVRAALATTWRLVIAYAAYVAIAGALLATGYEASTSKPFLYFGVVLVPIALVARAWGAAGGDTAWARAGRALLCGAAAMGGALLVLETVDASFLEGMGL